MNGTAGFPVVLRRGVASLDLWMVLVPVVPAFYAWMASMGLFPIIRELLALVFYAFFFGFAFTKMRGISVGDSEFSRNVSYTAGMGMGMRFLLVLAVPLALLYWLEVFPTTHTSWLLYPLVMFWVPASALIVGTTDRLAPALNPADILRVMGAMGLHYWLTLVCCTLVIWAAFNGGRWVLGGSQLMGVAVMSYCLMVGVALALTLLGAAAFTHGEKLGINAAFAADLETVGLKKSEPAEHEFIRVAKIREREDGIEAAARFLADELKDLYAPLEVHRYLLDLEIRAGRAEQVLAQGRRLIKRCLDEDRPDVALITARDCVTSDGAFAIGELDADDQLIQLAMNRGQYELAVSLCESFVRNFPRYRRSVDMSVTAADLLIDRYAQTDRARSLLIDAIARGAQGEQLDDIRRVMTKLGPGG